MQYVVVKKSKSIKKQEASGISSNLGLKTTLNKIRYLVIYCFGIIKLMK